MTRKSPSPLDDMPLPEPTHDPLAARDFVENLPALRRRLGRMSKRGRAHIGLALDPLSRAITGDGLSVAPSTLWRLEHPEDRSEINLLVMLYLFALYGY